MTQWNVEQRMVAAPPVRADGQVDGRPGKLMGYAVLFDSPADLGDFVEVVRPGAFARTLADRADVRCLFNHDPNLILGRTAAGTLRLSEDARGLRFIVDAPDTTLGRDVAESIRRGDVSGASFSFRVVDEKWDYRGPKPRRELLRATLIDVSPCAFPAYADTKVGVARMISAPAKWTMASMSRRLQLAEAMS